ncbi:hypothetical protein pdam_00020352 [Pocillopora damicornis]|uniref:Uncharacterized protein n=1 Tax=Pocillopora damicornis TaxID=46731 RepID=A0A3M6UCM5_POCDA|nr:hypothetical protein pdam_00020352 [Pocillopora damicornis]
MQDYEQKEISSPSSSSINRNVTIELCGHVGNAVFKFNNPRYYLVTPTEETPRKRLSAADMSLAFGATRGDEGTRQEYRNKLRYHWKLKAYRFQFDSQEAQT